VHDFVGSWQLVGHQFIDSDSGSGSFYLQFSPDLPLIGLEFAELHRINFPCIRHSLCSAVDYQ
jgi:hypothetical protein